MHTGAPSRFPLGRRRDARLRVGIPAQIITLFGQQVVNLIDLSQSGARVMAPSPIARTGDAVLYWMKYEAFGRIVWAHHNEAGIEFDELLPEALLIQTRDAVDTGKAHRFEQATYEGARSWYMGYRNA